MKQLRIFLPFPALAVLFWLAFFSVSMAGESDLSLNEDDQKVGRISRAEASYRLGLMLGIDNRSRYSQLDFDAFYRGFEDAYADRTLSATDRRAASDLLIEYYYQQLEIASATAIEEGEQYLEKNARRPDVFVTSSGLQIEVLEPGTDGDGPEPGDEFTALITGSRTDGSVVRNYYLRDSPQTIRLSEQDIPAGLVEGIQHMRPTARFKFSIPPELAHGRQRGGREMRPNETLIVVVELISINR